MRIISQDGRYDLPYEKVAVNLVGKTQIFAESMEIEEWSAVMANYSSIEKSDKAMDMLHNAYYQCKYQEAYKNDASEFIAMFRFPQDDEIKI